MSFLVAGIAVFHVLVAGLLKSDHPAFLTYLVLGAFFMAFAAFIRVGEVGRQKR